MSPRQTRKKTAGKKTSKKASRKKTSSRRRAAASVEEVTTRTEFRTVPKVEVRRAATLSQALTEPAVAVVKPETEAVQREIKVRRRAG